MEQKPLHYHKRTSDPALAPLFGVWFQKLRGLYEGGVRWYRKSFPFPYWRAELRIDQEHLHVELVPTDSAGFEFWTTGSPVSSGTVTQETVTLSSLKACAVQCRVRMDGENIAWDTTIAKSKRSTNGMELSLAQRPFQVQLVDEPVREPVLTRIYNRPKYLTTLYEAWTPGTSHSGVHTRGATQGTTQNVLMSQWVGGLPGLEGTLQGAKGAAGTHLLRDVMYDMPWARGEGGHPITYSLLNSETPGLTPAATTPVDWPRAAGIQMVKDATNGTREFAIYIDSFNQVSAFPTGHNSAPSGVNQTVDQKYVKTSSMNLPVWVFVPSTRLKDHYLSTGSTGVVEFPEYDWKLKHDGTKAVAVVYKKVDAVRDTAFTPTSATAANGYNLNETGVLGRASASLAGSDTRHWLGPGLVEISIAIALTGPNPEDFTLTVTSNALRDPETADYCTVFAGYVWYDIEDGSARQGDLCVWDIERYWRLPPASEMQDIWWGPGNTVTYDDRVGTLAGSDHERYWGHYYGIHNTGLTEAQLHPCGQDFRRTLYSLKNLTQGGRELRTLPGCPSGVANGYTLPGVTVPQSNGTYSSFTTLSYAVGMVPVEARSQFLKVDFTTLSFVMKFHVGTTDWRTNWMMPDGHGFPGANVARQWYVLHPAVAVWTQNTLRQTFYPDTMPTQYVAPPYYTEPAEAQVAIRTRLKGLIENDFRRTHMAQSGWTLVPLGGGVTSWEGSPEINALRYWAIWWFEGHSPTLPYVNLRNDALSYGGTTMGSTMAPEMAMWWSAICAYGSGVGLTVYSNPHFHWSCYADLIQNAVMYDPLTCFFTHPNGTWAYFDQTNCYNRNGLPDPHNIPFDQGGVSYTSTAGSSDAWDVTKIEHWIIDYVHLCFSLPEGKKAIKETGFRELYNDAVAAMQVPHTETFNHINLSDLKATFSIAPQGTSSPYGLSLRMDWHGSAFFISEDNLPAGTLNNDFQANGSTMDLSLNYLWGGVVPQLVANRITFSSCLLVEALDE